MITPEQIVEKAIQMTITEVLRVLDLSYQVSPNVREKIAEYKLSRFKYSKNLRKNILGNLK